MRTMQDDLVEAPKDVGQGKGDEGPKDWGTGNVAAVYNRAGDGYTAYADGDPERLFAFEGSHAYSDRRLWALLDSKLIALQAEGRTSLRLLDAGCGPGAWLRRLVIRARQLGFTRISARGFDVAAGQVQAARRLSRELSAQPGVEMRFEVADLSRPLPEANGSVDIALCLYSVLSHLPTAELGRIAGELGRVTRGWFVTTVRAVGGPPTVFVDSMENAAYFHHDHAHDQCEVQLRNGRFFVMNFHLFQPAELQAVFGAQFTVEDLRGLDLFHSRFARDNRWNPPGLTADAGFFGELEWLEEAYARRDGFMERATHLLLVGRARG
jgi:SAM-dependent methyltransferase